MGIEETEVKLKKKPGVISWLIVIGSLLGGSLLSGIVVKVVCKIFLMGYNLI